MDAVFVSTPYQLKNVFALIDTNVIVPALTRLFVIDAFADASAVADNLSSSSIFADVVDLPVHVENDARWDLHLFEPYERVFSAYPHDAMNEMFMRKNTVASPALHHNVPPIQPMLSMSPAQGQQRSELILFDEGIGSYISNEFLSYGNGLYSDAGDAAIYLTAPEMLLDDARWQYGQIKKLPTRLSASSNEALMSAFGSGNEMRRGGIENGSRAEYENERPVSSPAAIYLSQPWKNQDIIKSESEVVRLLQRMNMPEIMYRPHPRDARRNVPGMLTDTRITPWELLCASGHVDDDTVLIGTFSTAQFSPLLVSDAHPILVFTYKLAGTDAVPVEYGQLVDKIARLYEQDGYGEQVIVPNTIEELAAIICKLVPVGSNLKRNAPHDERGV